MTLSETTTRVLTAVVAIPVGVAAVVAGGWVLGGLLAIFSIASALEFYRLAGQKELQPLRVVGTIAAVMFVVLAAVAPGSGPDGAGFMILTVVVLLATSTAAIWARGVAGQPILAVSVTVMGSIYTGALLSFALFLRHLPGITSDLHGAALLFTPVLLTWASDTFAYFVGRAWGRHKLIPKVSPGKTVEGALGALAGSVLVAIGYSALLDQFPTYAIHVWQAVILGLLVSIAAQVGDLCESLFKRDAGAKDSGVFFPGHGGVLDRFDSLLFTLPLGYFVFRFLIGPSPL